MEAVVMGHGDVVFARPVSLLIVCHARPPESKPIDSTVSAHLSLRGWCYFRTWCCFCVGTQQIFTLVVPARELVGTAFPRNNLFGGIEQHLIRLVCFNNFVNMW